MFRLTGTDQYAKASYAQVEVVVNEAPSSGSLAMVPSKGFTFETDFKYTAESWVDADLPLAYMFVYAVGYDGTETPVADAQASASYECILPQGQSEDNYTVTGTVYVYDSYEAYASATDSVRVLPVKYTTAQLANVSDSLSTAALESGDPESCMQVLGATSKSMAGDDDGGGSRRRLLDAASSALRDSMLATLKATYAMSDMTVANVDSMLSTLEGIVNTPNDLSAPTAVDSLAFATRLLSATVDAEIGISDTSASYAGSLLSYLLRSALFNNSEAAAATAVQAENVTIALRYLAEAQLEGAYAGIGYDMSSTGIHTSVHREEAQYLGYGTSTAYGVVGSAAKISYPSNFSALAKLKLEGVSNGDYVDTRFATLDVDLYTSFKTYGNQIATKKYGDSKYNSDLNSDVTQIELMYDGAPLSIKGLSLSEPVVVTIEATEPIDTNFSAWMRYGWVPLPPAGCINYTPFAH